MANQTAIAAALDNAAKTLAIVNPEYAPNAKHKAAVKAEAAKVAKARAARVKTPAKPASNMLSQASVKAAPKTAKPTKAQLEQASQIKALRHEVAQANVRAYGAERAYAVALNDVYAFDWFAVEANDQGEQAGIVHAEKKALYVELKEAKHSNPSTVWARIRKYGKEERHGVAAKGEGANGEGEGEGDAGKPAARSPKLRYMEELLSLCKLGMRLGKDLPADCREAQKHVVAALVSLGVDMSTVKI